MDSLRLHRRATGRARVVLVALTAVCAAVTAWVPAGVAAQKRVQLTSDGLSCVSYEGCDLDTDCSGTDTCETVAAFDATVCTTTSGPARDILCCNPTDEIPCPDLGSGHGTCTSLVADYSICVYSDDERRLCYEEASTGDGRLAYLRACFSDATTGEPTSNWGAGDCDDDGIANAAETAGCVCNADLTCGLPDGGVGDDAGAPELDAGPGEEEDAGAAPEDAGPPERDAGTAEMDAGTAGGEDPLNGLDFRGSGGCSCDSGGGDGFPPAAALAVIVGAALARRRRRR